MANNDNYSSLVSENEGSSDEIIEITPVPVVRKKRGCSIKANTSKTLNQEILIILESAGEISNTNI